MTKGVFFFSVNLDFHEDIDESINYGFTFDFGQQPVYDFDNEDIDEQYELEEKYGVHNFVSMPDDRVIGIGFNSYEVERKNFKALMEDWRSVFEDMCDDVGDIVQFESDLECSDYEIYKLIEEQYD